MWTGVSAQGGSPAAKSQFRWARYGNALGGVDMMTGRKLFAGLLFCSFRLAAQTDSAVLARLLEQVTQMNSQVANLANQLNDSRRESDELRRELAALRQEVNALRAAPSSLPAPAPEQALALEEERQLLEAKVDDQYQTKVESSSKYRVKLSGMVVANVFSNQGSVDQLELPGQVEPRSPGESKGSFGASVRQSIFGLDVDGPTLWGARTHGDVRVDFFGGLPPTGEGALSGIVRLRTANFKLEWANHSVTVGQDVPFISPLNPTSLASTAYPAFYYSGNIWNWTPQIHNDHRFTVAPATQIELQWGVMNPLTGDNLANPQERRPNAGEQGRMPAYAARLGLKRNPGARQATAGVGAYYSRQRWGYTRRADAWAATADWDLPFARWFALSGELYRGRAMAGLGGGLSSSVLLNGALDSPATSVLPTDTAGGWTQLKFKPLQKIEFNGAFGGDFPFSNPRRTGYFAIAGEGSQPFRNTSGMANVIVQPRTNLLFSLEYRKLWTSPFDAPQRRASHISLGAGILF